MTRLSMTVPALALALATASLPASAIIRENDEVSRLPITPFDIVLNSHDNTPISISNKGFASALFAGQGWQYTAQIAGELAPWESPVGDPIPDSTTHELALMGQYPPVVPTPPGPSPAVDTALRQNVRSTNPSGFPERFGGQVNGFFYGVTSILFAENINTYSTGILDSGLTAYDNLGGPLWFAFFDRQGNHILCDQGGVISNVCLIARTVDGTRIFRSTEVNIAGVQIWHQDTRGLEFRTLQFGVEVPVPATLGLLLLGWPALRWARRSVKPGR